MASLAAAYLVLLVAPDPLFAYEKAGTFVVIHADEPIPHAAAAVIRSAETRVRRSPLFHKGEGHHVYVCQHAWRWRLLSNWRYGAGALAMAPVGRSIFTREAHFSRNRLVGPSGRETPGERTLDYFLAHEVTHTLTADYLGPAAFYRLPVWVREGYADYVGRAAELDYDTTRARLLGGDPALDPARSGLYLRYVLLVAHLLDRERWSVEDLLHRPPPRAAVEARVRTGRIESRQGAHGR